MLHVKLPEIFTDVVTQSFFRHPISKYAILQRPLRRIYFLSVGPGFWVNEVARVVPCQMLETIGSEPVIGLAAVCYNRRAWHNILMYQGEQFFLRHDGYSDMASNTYREILAPPPGLFSDSSYTLPYFQ
jgi:hypothetical protein